MFNMTSALYHFNAFNSIDSRSVIKIMTILDLVTTNVFLDFIEFKFGKYK